MVKAGTFSIWAKKINVTIDDVEYDISDKISDWVWRYKTEGNDNNINNPKTNWEIRKELGKEVTKIVKEITGSNNVHVLMQ